MKTVKDITFDLLRKLELTTIVGNPGSTEETFLKNFPNAKVWAALFAEQTPFPENHDLYAGSLPAAIGPFAEQLIGHDLVIVIGAPVFRYYPFVPGQFLPTDRKSVV